MAASERISDSVSKINKNIQSSKCAYKDVPQLNPYSKAVVLSYLVCFYDFRNSNKSEYILIYRIHATSLAWLSLLKKIY